MVFQVVVVYFSRRGRLPVLANIIAAGARSVAGGNVTIYRVPDPVGGDDPSLFDAGALDAPVVTAQVLLDADCILLGAPGRQGGIGHEMRHFLDGFSDYQLQTPGARSLKGKVGGAFTSVGGVERGFGGHELILTSFMAWFMQHGVVCAGVPPSALMDTTPYSSPYGTVMAGHMDDADTSLTAGEVKLAYSQGEWAASIAKQLHDDEVDAHHTLGTAAGKGAPSS